MESTRFGKANNDFSGGVAGALALLDRRIAEMKAEPEADWMKREREHELRVAHNRRAARGIPDRFLDASLKNWLPNTPQKTQAKADLESWSSLIGLPLAPSIVLLGANGTGKTYAGCGILNDRLDGLYQGRGLDARRHPEMDGLYTTMKGYTDKVKATYRKGSDDTEHDVLELYATAPVLVLDEIGRQFDSEAEKLYAFDLINTRYNAHRQTMFIGNLTSKEFETFMGPALYDRIKDGGGKILTFNWPSLRS